MSIDEKYEIEVDYRVVDNVTGATMHVGPDRDGLGCVEVYTGHNDKLSEDHFGKTQLVLSPALALCVAQAMIKAAEDAVAKERKR